MARDPAVERRQAEQLNQLIVTAIRAIKFATVEADQLHGYNSPTSRFLSHAVTSLNDAQEFNKIK